MYEILLYIYIKMSIYSLPCRYDATLGQRAVVDELVRDLFHKMSEGKVTWHDLAEPNILERGSLRNKNIEVILKYLISNLPSFII